MTQERPIRRVRRERLVALIADAGGAAELARLTGTPKTHISAIQNGAREIGDDLATKLEGKLGRPFGWMDGEAAPLEAASPVLDERAAADMVGRLAKLLDTMDEAQRERVAQRLQTLTQAPDSMRAREALVTALCVRHEEQKPLGAPIAPEHLAELEQLAEEAESQHGKTGQQRRRAPRR